MTIVGSSDTSSVSGDDPAAKTPESNGGVIRDSGFVLVCDIVGFSEKKEGFQKACIEHLNSTLCESSFWKEFVQKAPGEYVLNCIGDGFLLVVTDPKVLTKPTTLFDLIRDIHVSVGKWNKANAGNPESTYQFRTGLHLGGFYMGLPIFGGKNAIGRGLNTAHRITGIGDAEHVLFSEDVKQYLRDSPDLSAVVGRANADQGSSRGWPVITKHGVELRVHAWTGTHDGQSVGASSKPRRVLVFEGVQKMLLQELEALCGLLEETLQAISPALAPRVVKLRISILYANLRDKKLICTPLRVWPWGPYSTDTDRIPKSDLLYPVNAEGDDVWGMPAYIYLGKPSEGKKSKARLTDGGSAVQFHLRLPEWIDGQDRDASRSQREYSRELESRWRISEDKVRLLGRKARAYFGATIPGFGLEKLGVVMVDSQAPLNEVSTKKNKEALAKVLCESAEHVLRPLVHIRYSP